MAAVINSAFDPIQAKMKATPKPGYANSFPPFRPLRVVGIKANHVNPNKARTDCVESHVKIGDLCFLVPSMEDAGDRMGGQCIQAKTGSMLPSYFMDYLLFEFATEVEYFIIGDRGN